MKLEYQPFYSFKTQYVVVYWDLVRRNREFLENFDPEYFQDNILCRDHKKEFFASQLRTLYSQSLETVFALLYTFLQTPFLQMAWLNTYKLCELRSLVETTTSMKE